MLVMTSGMGLAAGIAAALATAGHRVVNASEAALLRPRGKSVAGKLYATARRKASHMPHQGAKESAKRYAEFKNPHTGHVTVGRIY